MAACSAYATCRRTCSSLCCSIDCPTLLFPFLRRVVADVTRDGGFPPLMLDPIDFRRLYAQNAARAKAASLA